MHRAQTRHQNQTRQVNAAEDDDRALSHRVTEDMTPEEITDPATGAFDLKDTSPVVQKPRLQMQETRARRNEKNDPAQAATHFQFAVEELRAAEAEQRRGEQIRRGADQEITDARGDRADWPEEILRRPVRRRGGIEQRDPGWDVFWNVGNEGEEKKRPGPEEDEGVNFIPCIVLRASGHRPT